MFVRRFAPSLSASCRASAMRFAATTSGSNNANASRPSGNNSNRGNNNNQNNTKWMPPAFDVMRPNNADLAKGYLGRIIFNAEPSNTVNITYMKQILSTATPSEGPARFFDSQNRINVPLSPVYFSRVLAVLEGMSDRCDIATRSTQGSFAPAADPHSFTLKCVTTFEQQQPVSWEIDFDAAHSLMLHRFLREALHCSHGFGPYQSVGATSARQQ